MNQGFFFFSIVLFLLFLQWGKELMREPEVLDKPFLRSCWVLVKRKLLAPSLLIEGEPHLAAGLFAFIGSVLFPKDRLFCFLPWSTFVLDWFCDVFLLSSPDLLEHFLTKFAVTLLWCTGNSKLVSWPCFARAASFSMPFSLTASWHGLGLVSGWMDTSVIPCGCGENNFLDEYLLLPPAGSGGVVLHRDLTTVFDSTTLAAAPLLLRILPPDDRLFFPLPDRVLESICSKQEGKALLGWAASTGRDSGIWCMMSVHSGMVVVRTLPLGADLVTVRDRRLMLPQTWVFSSSFCSIALESSTVLLNVFGASSFIKCPMEDLLLVTVSVLMGGESSLRVKIGDVISARAGLIFVTVCVLNLPDWSDIPELDVENRVFLGDKGLVSSLATGEQGMPSRWCCSQLGPGPVCALPTPSITACKPRPGTGVDDLGDALYWSRSLDRGVLRSTSSTQPGYPARTSLEWHATSAGLGHSIVTVSRRLSFGSALGSDLGLWGLNVLFCSGLNELRLCSLRTCCGASNLVGLCVLSPGLASSSGVFTPGSFLLP